MSSITPLILASLILPGQQVDEAGQDATRQAAARLAIMKSEAARYDFLDAPGGKDKAVQHPEPLLRWTNPVAEEEDAALFLWTRDGRPEAVAQFFVRKDNWMHEFQSLNLKPPPQSAGTLRRAYMAAYGKSAQRVARALPAIAALEQANIPVAAFKGLASIATSCSRLDSQNCC